MPSGLPWPAFSLSGAEVLVLAGSGGAGFVAVLAGSGEVGVTGPGRVAGRGTAAPVGVLPADVAGFLAPAPSRLGGTGFPIFWR